MTSTWQGHATAAVPSPTDGAAEQGGRLGGLPGPTGPTERTEPLLEPEVLDAGVRIEVAVTSQPWLLPIDTLVVSVGPRGLGHLGAAVLRRFPELRRDDLPLASTTPDEPQLLRLRGPEETGSPEQLRRIVLACPRDLAAVPLRSGEAPATLNAVARATASAVELAVDDGAVSLGLPLLGTGAIGFPPSEVAFEVVPTVREVLRSGRTRPGGLGTLRRLVFVTQDPAVRRAIARVWRYQRMLAEVREQALADRAVLAEAQAAGVSAAELAAAVDLPEQALWQPCVSELSVLRQADKELDDLRRSLVGHLEASRAQVLLESGTSGAGRSWKWTPGGNRSEERLSQLDREIRLTLAGDHRWRDLLVTRQGALASLRAAVLEESVLPRLRETINQRLHERRSLDLQARRAEFRRRLPRVDTKGLRGSPRPGGLVHTAAHDELTGLLDPARTMRASIGIAGPRGCGKSTLLKEVTSGWTGGLSILVSAPTSYASREFLLHLYGRVCEEVLAKDRDSRVRLGLEPVPVERVRTATRLQLVAAPAVLLGVGVAALVASDVWGRGQLGLRSAGGAVLLSALVPILLLLAGPLRAGEERRDEGVPRLLSRDTLRWRLPAAQRVLAVGVVAGAVVVAASFGLLTIREMVGLAVVSAALGTSVFVVAAERDHQVQAAVPPGADQPAPDELSTASVPDDADVADTTSGSSGHQTFDSQLELARRAVVVVGVAGAQVAAVAAGVALLATDAADVPLDNLLVLGAVVVASGLTATLAGLRFRQAIQEEWGARLAPPADPDSFQARRDLTKIRYQRSVSSGWTSSLKVSAGSWLPFGMDAGTSGGITESEVPLSAMEIVQGINTLLPARGPAVLAIDELDKIESVEEARTFLNEIKGILEAPETRCLVSMSEDAIARFERRGLPFRDVFDSAFDEVIRVPYLSAAEARKLLDQRVTDVPEPFLALAFCLSGGLPRDLLRAADRLVTVGQSVASSVAGAGRPPADPGPPSAPLADVLRAVVHRDMAGKVGAVAAAMKRLSVEPEVSSLLRCVQSMDRCPPLGPRRRPCLLDDEWLEALGKLRPVVSPTDDRDLEERRELLRLGVELVGYLYYCRTLLELFSVDEDEDVDRLIRLVDEGGACALDELALARQNFAVNPFVAWEQLDSVRAASGLATCALPAPFVVPVR